MTDRFLRMAFVWLVLLAAPAGLLAQQGSGTAAPQLPPEAQELIQELQQVQARLEPIQQQALQDPQVQEAQQALGDEVQAAMTEVDPETPQRIERLQVLMSEAQAAQAEQDEAAMGEIVAEAQGLEQRLQAAQAEAVQRPDIAPQVEQFQAQLLEKMVELDPDVESLIEQAKELDARLAALLNPTS